MSRRRRKIPAEPQRATIQSLSHEGRGVASIDGKTTFIHGALPGEQVMFKYLNRRAKFDEGYTVDVVEASSSRQAPACEHFGVCGGCSLQHMTGHDQIRHKQAVLRQQFEHVGSVAPEDWFEPLTGPEWGYRRKARLGVKYVARKEKVLVGFREIYSRFVADIKTCKVLHPSVGEKLTVLQDAVARLDIYNRLPQIEVAVSDDVTVLVIRHLDALSNSDRENLIQLEEELDVIIFLQPKGPDSICRLSDRPFSGLRYRLPDHNIEIVFQPTDFTQVNTDINRKMVNRVIDLLQPDEHDQVLDLFCGLGNFTLPLARYCKHITGVEVDAGLIERARFNAMHNQIKNADFVAADLMQADLTAAFLQQDYSKVLLDPPRTGAKEVIDRLDLTHVQTLVYVSCNPATLARDAGILVNEKKMKLIKAGVMDMFPHTSHVESIALFTH